MFERINKRIRRWCLGSYLRHRVCLLLNMLFALFVVPLIVAAIALKRYISELVTEVKELWDLDGYKWLRKEEDISNEK